MSSWITGLADRAENILNKLDQNAATALQNSENDIVTIKRNLTNSTQSLKATLSPSKLSSSSFPSRSDSVFDTKSDMSKSENIMINISETPRDDTVYSANLDTQELAAFKIALGDITAERDALRLRLAEIDRDNVQYMTLQEEFEKVNKAAAEERARLQQELNTLQSANASYVHAISELESSMAKLKQEYLKVKQQFELQKKETEQQSCELQEYRAKAQRALLAKDALIAELKSAASTDKTTTNDEQTVLPAEHDAIKQELQHVIEERQKLLLQLEVITTDKKQLDNDLLAASFREESLNKELRAAREYGITIDSEQRILRQELDALRQQLSNQMAAAATRLQEKEQELQQLRRTQISNRVQDNKKDDYENRLKALTQSLVERQSALESITADRNALRLQFEKVQLQLQQLSDRRELESQRSLTGNTLLSNSTDDVKAQFPLLMHPNPFDNRVARRVKRAYTSLDSAGIRLGAFLRRYPLMRIGVLMYVALLHLWVMFVLLSTTPN